MMQYVPGSRFLVALLLGALVWGELATTRAGVGEAAETPPDTTHPTNVSSRGGPRLLYSPVPGHDVLVVFSRYPDPTPTSSPTPSPTSTPTLEPTPTPALGVRAAFPNLRTTHLGMFKVTAYSDSPLNGTDGRGITASGVRTHWGAVAVDPGLIPLGTRLLLEGFPETVFTALDTGGGVRGRWVDIWFPTDWEAIQWGTRYLNVFLVVE